MIYYAIYNITTVINKHWMVVVGMTISYENTRRAHDGNRTSMKRTLFSSVFFLILLLLVFCFLVYMCSVEDDALEESMKSV